MLLSIGVTFSMETIAGAWQILMALGAGTGLVYILRWFWWRINAWSEISAMVAAFITSLTLRFVFNLNEGNPVEFAYLLLTTVAITTVVWVMVTFLTKPESKEILISFYRRVRPNPTFWKPIAEQVKDVIPQKDGLFSFVNWISGVALIYFMLFGIGKLLLGEPLLGIVMITCGFIAGGIVYRNMSRRGWETLSGEEIKTTINPSTELPKKV
jgi:hypothetical protein